MKIIVSNSELMGAIKKASVAVKDTYVVTVTKRKEEMTGKYYASIAACDGVIMSSIAFLVTYDGEIKEQQVILGKELLSTVSTLSQYAPEEDITLETGDGKCKICCGGASANVGLLMDALSITSANPKKDECTVITIASNDFKNAVSRGSMAASMEDGKLKMYKNTLFIQPVKVDGDADAFRIITVDSLGTMVAGSHVKIAGEVKPLIEGKRQIALNKSIFCKVIENLSSQNVQLFIFKNQVIVRDINDIYILIPSTGQCQEKVGSMLFAHLNSNFSFRVNKKKFQAAIDIAMLNGGTIDGKHKVALSLDGGKLLVSSVNKTNHTIVDVENAEGCILIGVNGSYLKNVLSHMGENVILAGGSSTEPIYITDGTEGFNCFIYPCQLNTEDTETQEE